MARIMRYMIAMALEYRLPFPVCAKYHLGGQACYLIYQTPRMQRSYAMTLLEGSWTVFPVNLLLPC